MTDIHDAADKMAMQLRAYEAVTMPGQPFIANTVRPWLENNYRMRSYAADLIRTLSTRLREAEARPALDLTPVRDALHQYINDMKYPPERDSRERRIAMAQAALALIDWEKGND